MLKCQINAVSLDWRSLFEVSEPNVPEEKKETLPRTITNAKLGMNKTGCLWFQVDVCALHACNI